jgi:hypothetical protein
MSRSLSLKSRNGDFTVSPKLYIEGVSVEELLTVLFEQRKEEMLRSFGNFSIEVIAWEPLLVAADRHCLFGILDDLLSRMIAVADGGEIYLRAYPSHDEQCVSFEVACEMDSLIAVDVLEDWERYLDRIRYRIRCMGGEFMLVCPPRGGVKICFWLAQWIQHADERIDSLRQQVA